MEENPIKRLYSDTIDKMCELTEESIIDLELAEIFAQPGELYREAKKFGEKYLKEYLDTLSTPDIDTFEIGAVLCRQGFDEEKPISLGLISKSIDIGTVRIYPQCNESGEDSIGMFHTHPTNLPYPSVTDVEEMETKYDEEELEEKSMQCIGGRNAEKEVVVNCFVPKEDTKYAGTIYELYDSLKLPERFFPVETNGKLKPKSLFNKETNIENEKKLKDWFENYFEVKKFEC